MHIYFTDAEKDWIIKDLFDWKIKDNCPNEIKKSLNEKLKLIGKDDNVQDK